MNEKDANYIDDFLELGKAHECKLKWGAGIDKHNYFLLGFNLNIQKDVHYICIYLGFITIVLGKEYF